jgi:hypothetical protein
MFDRFIILHKACWVKLSMKEEQEEEEDIDWVELESAYEEIVSPLETLTVQVVKCGLKLETEVEVQILSSLELTNLSNVTALIACSFVPFHISIE